MSIEGDFEYAETEDEEERESIVIFGYKGTGKTTLAFGWPGTKHCLSYDQKAIRVKKHMYASDPDIHVFDATKYYTHAKDALTASAARTHDYVLFILENIPSTDWVIHDSFELLIEIAEMKMRHDHNIGPFQGFQNRSLWKDRKLNLRDIHEKSMQAARKGVIYTTWSEHSRIVLDGTLVSEKEVPRYIDLVMAVTDVVVHTEEIVDKDKLQFLATVVTSKQPGYPTGKTFDVTGKTLFEAMAAREFGPPVRVPEIPTTGEACPDCGAPLVTAGSLTHCSTYPDCKYVQKGAA